MTTKITTLIKDYEFETIIGMLDFERVKPQKIRINANFTSDGFIDYVEIINFIENFYNEHKFQSVEESVEKISIALKQKFSNLTSLNLEILKLEILKNALVGAKVESIY
ncbi:dihydroneopterin aldolase [Campylobacter sp. RM9344]|uniref:Dihydroneopterin aldolase n=1 Tax=Campylobacter californiensis TaxID=1032243 RepID=A0AAW3ZXJ0_9BACT|nr:MULTISPECIES: dihydroneopterin aldolase [unclassified Campylobacter]MBE2984182.1 dihydroneopterin aldolase [Campylobacter sp. RM6883]MBE2986194.1 dihydroneopterin aldolase [Campylobacter sp. RM12919]MBE2988191.1 dihydroneopterin aldolase [Campylobacter sp. RM12920]MBE2995551.1 dihydroneopterin aldolase [Campylobacter sp. RM6913]MBE3029780.1 dihydroneopterin aldolase [Campylobacter sp. RM9344]